MNWNTEINDAPKGAETERKNPRGEGTYTEFVPEHIIVATKCGKVTRSYWIPKEGRWCMLAKNEQPVAWMPWPSHPSKAI